MPGSSKPSRNSKEAPPPVEMWVILSADVYKRQSIAYMEEESCREKFDRALLVARSLTTEREYDILEALSPFDGDKDGFLQLLTDLDAVMAQVAAAGTGSANLRQAAALAQKIRPMQAVQIHELMDEIRLKILYNGNGTLLQNLFCARLKTIMER